MRPSLFFFFGNELKQIKLSSLSLSLEQRVGQCIFYRDTRPIICLTRLAIVIFVNTNALLH